MNPDGTSTSMGTPAHETPEEKRRREWRERQRAARERKKNENHHALLCRDCGQEIYQTIVIDVKVPLGWNDLTKNGLRSDKVELLGARWESAIEHCACKPKMPRRRRSAGSAAPRPNKNHGNKC